jgi:hypothetical protein
MTKLVHCRKGPYDIYIGRACFGLNASKWQNPFIIGKDGTRKEVIDKYEKYIRTNQELLKDIEELRDKTLACWCNYPNEDCHGRVLLNILKEQEYHEFFDIIYNMRSKIRI